MDDGDEFAISPWSVLTWDSGCCGPGWQAVGRIVTPSLILGEMALCALCIVIAAVT